MSLFTDERGNVKPLKVAAWGLAGVFLVAGSCSTMYVNEERQVSLEVLFGRVTDKEDTAGLKIKNPIATRFAYSLARQKTEVAEAVNLRTEDDLRLSGRYHVEYEVDEHADVNKLYFDLKDQGGDLDNVVEIRAKDSAVRTIEALKIKDIMPDTDSAVDTPGDGKSLTDTIKEGIKTRLQAVLSEEGWPVRVIGVYSDGFHFSMESEKKIEDIVGLRADKVKLSLREENADKAKGVFKAEAEADAAYIGELRKAGLPAADVGFALCMKMSRDAGRVNEPFSPGCSGNAKSVGAVVDQQGKPPAKAKQEASAPQPQ